MVIQAVTLASLWRAIQAGYCFPSLYLSSLMLHVSGSITVQYRRPAPEDAPDSAQFWNAYRERR